MGSFGSYLNWCLGFNVNHFVQIQSFDAACFRDRNCDQGRWSASSRGVCIHAPAILEVIPEVEVLADIPYPSNK